ncbi:MAG: S9 family peptidase, partial [Anaerolineae bacterium]|nr:S9 family peptidase [Anaerolineae bacterium]
LYWYDIDGGEAVALDHPRGVLGGGQFTAEGEIYTIWQDATHPPCLIALDCSTGAQRHTVLQAGSAPGGRRRQQFRFTSENGDQIQGWLSVPDGAGPFPMILHTHGGPTSVKTDAFMPTEQAWLDHGFAFASINYHGSVTFGQDFKKSIWGNLGDLEVQDMAAAYRWLVDQGVADPKAVFLTGGSYGGYLTLQAIGRRPKLWAGGMAVVAIADWKLMYEDQAETLRGYQRGLFGGTPEETPEATASASPISYAEQIAAPILVIQGRNDTRCPARQMIAYEEKLRALGKPITVHWFDAGHGSRAQEQQIEHQEWMMRFVYAVLEKNGSQD